MSDEKKAVGTDLLNELKDIDDLTGDEVQRLMDKYGVSRSTVFRAKKKAAAISNADDLSADDEKYLQNQNIIIPKKLQGKIDRVAYYKAYMSDSEEGWTFTKAKGDALQEGNGLVFCGIVYADSLEEFKRLLEPLISKGFQICWIWHDKDFWTHDSPEVLDNETGTLLFDVGERYKAGDPKKFHGHVMIKYASQTSWFENQEIVQKVFGIHTVMWEKVKNPMGMYRYFCHDTDAARETGKFQYPKSERHLENGFRIDLSKYEKDCIYTEVSYYINHGMYEEFGRYELADLMEKYSGDIYTLGVIRGSGNTLPGQITSMRNIMIHEQAKKQKKISQKVNFISGSGAGYDPSLDDDDEESDVQIDEETGEIIEDDDPENEESEDDD